MYNQKMFYMLFEASIRGGALAKDLQKGIVNEGKIMASEADDSARLIAMRNAKTKADVAVQDILLRSLLEFKAVLSLDAEEDSSLISEFENKEYECTCVIDPIDGTLEYVEQKDDYSICSAIIEQGDMKCAMVYFPNLNDMYTYEEKLGINVYNIDANHNANKCLTNYQRPKKLPNKIYVNSRIPAEFANKLKEQGYELESDDEILCPNALLNCLNGEGLAYIGYNRNIRDILIGVIIAKLPFGSALDIKFNDLVWKSKGKQPFVIFTIYDKNDLWH